MSLYRLKRTQQVRNKVKNTWSREWFQFVLDHSNKRLDFYDISRNENITWEIIQENPYFPWNMSGISRNPNVTWEIIQNHPELKWN